MKCRYQKLSRWNQKAAAFIHKELMGRLAIKELLITPLPPINQEILSIKIKKAIL